MSSNLTYRALAEASKLLREHVGAALGHRDFVILVDSDGFAIHLGDRAKGRRTRTYSDIDLALGEILTWYPEPEPVRALSHPIPDYADVMSVPEFVQRCRSGLFTSNDGSGHYATRTHEFDVSIDPDEAAKPGFKPDPRFTHVAWYNK